MPIFSDGIEIPDESRGLRSWRLFSVVLTLSIASHAAADDIAQRTQRFVEEPMSAVDGVMAVEIAQAWVETLLADELERRLAARPELVAGVFGTLGAAFATADDDALPPISAYTTAVTRAWSRRLSERGGPWRPDEVRLLTALLLVDPSRFAGDEHMRRRVLAALPQAMDPASAPALRDRVLATISGLRGVEYDAFEDVAFAWGALARKSFDRRYSGDERLILAGEKEPIRASIYSLPESLFSDAEAVAFLQAVRQAAPSRDLVVLTGHAFGERLRKVDPKLHLVATHGFAYSPWPRDPLTFLRDAEGRQVVMLRPNVQATREDDLWLGRTLVQGLDDNLDAAWGRLRWQRAEVPFHNGQILAANAKLWVSIHSLEPRALEIAGFDHVPVSEFATAKGARYVAAVRQAATELGALYGHDAVFVHPLPPKGADGESRAAALRSLGGGAGFDLDSLVTLLASPDGSLTALVADLNAGSELIASAGDDELASFAAAYDLEDSHLRQYLKASQTSPRGRQLDTFLEAVATHLGEIGALRRLPILLMPQGGGGDYSDPDFLVGWNNVVLEERNGVLRAEGFASWLASGDALATETYGASGYRLELVTPLVGSVRRNGGYRCASQHVRGFNPG